MVTTRTLNPPRGLAMRAAAARSNSLGARKPGRTLARLTDAEVHRRMPSFRRKLNAATMAIRVAKAEVARQAKAAA